jgi:hypothetical protein
MPGYHPGCELPDRQWHAQEYRTVPPGSRRVDVGQREELMVS